MKGNLYANNVQNQCNEENLLIRSDGTYNQDIHSKLSKIITNIAQKNAGTNPGVSVEDLEQEAWVKIFEILKKGIPREINYLVVVAKNAILAYCLNYAHKRENIDEFATFLMSSTENVQHGTSIKLNIAKAKLEHEISQHVIDEDHGAIMRILFENVIDKCEDNEVKYFIIIKYVKEFCGTSEKILHMYKEFYNSLDSQKQDMLSNMPKCTNNLIFKILGMRATDNKTTLIRSKVKDTLYELNQLCV